MFNKEVDELRENLPDKEDLTGAVKAILRIQDMYDIPAKQIAAGNVGGVQTGELSGKSNIRGVQTGEVSGKDNIATLRELIV